MDNIIAQRIKEAMTKRGLKQVDIVNKTGINKGALSSYINGNYSPKDSNLEKLSQVLNVNKMWLLGYDVPMEDLYNKIKDIHFDEKFCLTVQHNIGKYKKGQILIDKEIFDYSHYLEQVQDELYHKMELIKKAIY